MAKRERGIEALLGLVEHALAIHQLLSEHCLHAVRELIQLIFGVPVERHVQRHLEELLGSLGEVIAELLNVPEGCFSNRVTGGALLGIGQDLRFKLTDLVPQLLEHDFRPHGVEKHADVQGHVEVDNRCKPTDGDVPGVGDHEHCAGQLPADFNIARVHLE